MYKHVVFFVLLLLGTIRIVAQNLVLNPDFEQHSSVKYAWQTDVDIASWKREGFHSFVFDTRYKAFKSDVEQGYDPIKYSPHSGHSMVQLRFLANTAVRCPEGGGAYLQTQLRQPLDTTKAYAVRYWVYMPVTNAFVLQPDLPYFFGMAFADKPFHLAIAECMPISTETLNLKSAERAEWHEVKYIIRPRKNYTHIMLGVFQNPYQPIVVNNKRFDKTYHYEQEFFVDDIVIEPIQTDTGAVEFPRVVTTPPVVDESTPNWTLDWIVYFEKGSDSLSINARLCLDSLVLQMQADRDRVYEITGHTDHTGANNRELSLQRAAVVQHYLTHKSPDLQYRLRYSGAADSLPVASNTAAGQPLNRRAEIHRTQISVSQNLYFLASQSAQKQETEAAFRLLHRWLKLGNADPVLLLFDPELSAFRNMPSWSTVEKAVKKHYQTRKKSAYAYQLDYLYCQDQWYRGLASDYEAAKGYIPAELDVIILETLAELTEKPDSVVLAQFLRLVDREGWPLISEVGTRPAQAAVLILLHAEDVGLMHRFLPILEAACKKGEGKWMDFANLTDRARLNSGQKQLYGTQFTSQPSDPDFFELSPVENPEKMNEYRAQIGLPPVQVKSFTIKRQK